MIIMTLDFESFYDPAAGYTLAKMPTQQYLRDPRFKCLGASVVLEDATTVWTNFVPPEKLDAFFAALPWDGIRLVCHNAGFDYALLREHWPHLPKPAEVFCTRDMARYLVSQGILPPDQRVSLSALMPLVGMEKGDTLAATRAGGEVLANYAIADAVATSRLYSLYAHRVPDAERRLIDLHARMKGDAILQLDTAKLAPLAEAKPDPAAAKLRSKATLAAALRRLGVEPETKAGKRGEDYAFAKTDQFMQSLLEHEDPVVQMLATLRIEGQSNIVRTRAQRLLDCGSPIGMPVSYYSAHTGRAGGSDGINVQNLPARDPNAAALRASLVAPEGHSLVIVDSAQIEVRVNAWLAKESWLLDAMAAGHDPYTAYAAASLGVAPGAVTRAQRQWAKAPVLAFGFGQGAVGYQTYCRRSGISIDEARAAQECAQYRALHPNIVATWKEHYRSALTGLVTLPSGRKLTYPDIRQEGREVTFLRPAIFSRGKGRQECKLWHGTATENAVQGVARDVVMEQTLRCLTPWMPCVLMVHDEAVFVVRDERSEEAAAIASEAFCTAPSWAPDLPVSGEAKIAKEYGK